MSTQKISGAEAVVKCLLAEGSDLIYGYPGGAIMPVYDELYKYQEKIHHVLTRHEQGAIHAAQGFARVSELTVRSGSCYFWPWSNKFGDRYCRCSNRFYTAESGIINGATL